MKITVQQEDLILLPDKALLWPKKQMLVIADLHLGKAATIRSYGIPIPEGNMRDDLDRLRDLIVTHNVKTCVIAGDLIHSKKGLSSYTVSSFEYLIKSVTAEIHLVIGNHDLTLKKELPPNWKLETHLDKFVEKPFVFKHFPIPDQEGFTWSGHIHPSIEIQYTGVPYKFPCFVIDDRVGILPAFSSLASGLVIKPQPNQKIFGIANQKIFSFSKGD